jgi:hypothetical protein
MQPKLYRWYPDKDNASVYLAINDGTNYVSRWPNSSSIFAQASVGITEIQRSGRAPSRASKKYQSKLMTIIVHPKTSWIAAIDVVNKYFDPQCLTLGRLLIQDEANSSKVWYVDADVEEQPRAEPGADGIQIRLRVYDPIWKSNTQVTDTWNITASGQTHDIAIANGNRYIRPIYRIKPTLAKTGTAPNRVYRAWYNPTSDAMPDQTIDIMDNAWNHSALVSGSKSQADGDDVLVFVDRRKVPRWFSGLNTTTAQVFVVLDFEPGITLTLDGAIASSGAITEITFQKTASNYLKLQQLATKRNYTIAIGSEIFTFTTITPLDFSVGGTVTRAAYGSSMAAHATAASCYWIQYEILVQYGNLSATAPEQDETQQPILDLANTTNGSWKWLTFCDDSGLRASSWKSLVKQGSGVKTYTGSHTADADPATEIGLSSYTYYQNGVLSGDTFEMYWQIYDPAGFTTLSINGDKKRISSDWPGLVAIQVSTNGTAWTTITGGAIATPTLAAAWQAWSLSSVALGGTYYYVRMIMKGSIRKVAGNQQHLEAQTATFVRSSARIPQLAYAEVDTGGYELDCRFKNSTTGEYIDLNGLMDINQELELDTDAKKITYLKDNTPADNFVVRWPKRGEWLAQDPLLGANTLVFTDTGTRGVTITTLYRERNT